MLPKTFKVYLHEVIIPCNNDQGNFPLGQTIRKENRNFQSMGKNGLFSNILALAQFKLKNCILLDAKQ